MEKLLKNKNIIYSIIIVLLFIIFMFYFLSNKSNTNINNNIENDTQIKLINNNINNNELNTQINNMEETINNIQIAKNGDLLVMNYTGRLIDGKVFDSNILPEFNHVEPFKFTLGAGQVITGWEEGLLGMKIGEKKTLTITPEKGYGDRQVGPIPANSTLIFDVELVAIE